MVAKQRLCQQNYGLSYLSNLDLGLRLDLSSEKTILECMPKELLRIFREEDRIKNNAGQYSLVRVALT